MAAPGAVEYPLTGLEELVSQDKAMQAEVDQD
jgi:hypothetical protein